MNRLKEIVGESIVLSLMTQKDLPKYMELYQDSEFMKNFGEIEGVEQTNEQWYEWFLGLDHRQDERVYSIFERNHDSWIGFIMLMDIDEEEKEAWLVIGLDAAWRNRGYGTQALKAVIQSAFLELELRVLKLSVLGENERAIRVYEHLGFEVELIYPRLQFPNVFNRDIIQYQLTRSRWNLLL